MVCTLYVCIMHEVVLLECGMYIVRSATGIAQFGKEMVHVHVHTCITSLCSFPPACLSIIWPLTP